MWIKIDDSFPDHPKLMGCRDYDRALSVMVRALCYSARHLTDGFLPERLVKTLGPGAIKDLAAAGLIHPEPGGYRIHDYLDYNPSREEVMRRRAERSRSGKAGAARRWGGSKSDSDGNSYSYSHGNSYGVCSDHVNAPVPVPNKKTRSCRSMSGKTGIPESVLGYWCGKAGCDEPSPEEALSLTVLCKRYPQHVVTLAIGQAALQGDVRNFGLITAIVKAEHG